MKYAVLDNISRAVVNIVEWDGKTNWRPPVGQLAVKFDPAKHNQTTENPERVEMLRLSAKLSAQTISHSELIRLLSSERNPKHGT